MSQLNNCMNQKKKKDQLTHAQFQALRIAKKDTLATNMWIQNKSTGFGLSVDAFISTHPLLLQAQQAAQILLKTQAHLLNANQTQTLELFTKRMAHKNTRIKLKPNAAYPILNINARINRLLFKLYKQL
jgi:hypothetical protein